MGAIVLIGIVYDVIRTTLSAAGAGALTDAVGRSIWRISGRAAWAGPVVLLSTAVLWVVGLWAGWTLVFLSAPEAVVRASTGASADAWGRLYFAGYTVVTLGLGDVVPGGPLWRVLTVGAAASGLVLLTLGVTYYGSVLSAVVEKQQLAEQIDGLGCSPADMVCGTWDGNGFSGLDVLLGQIGSGIVQLDRYHYAYPVVHFFREGDPSAALSVQLARLNDALHIWESVVVPHARPAPATLVSTRSAMIALIGTLRSLVDPADDVPPLPDLASLVASGIPHVDASATFEAHDRALLLGYVREHGRDWPAVDPLLQHTSP
jgi:hypothetical protein